ncbi:MAG: DUF1828 domain-containing protein [Thermodesulfovibrio sp.]|nr:DUF1828 domain-containing protein [Thermodesulfovibrio sp.]
MDIISKKVSLPKTGTVKITFYRDRRKATKDKTTFSLPFDVQFNEKIALGEIIYSPVYRSCRVLWNVTPEDNKFQEETENFIKEFLFGTLMSVTEPITRQEAESIINNYLEFFKNSIKYRITEQGICEITLPIGGKELKEIKFLIRKKDTGDFIISDDSLILRQFRPHERGQRERVIFAAKKLGIDIKDEELSLESSLDELSNNLQKFVQIISAVYIFYLT